MSYSGESDLDVGVWLLAYLDECESRNRKSVYKNKLKALRRFTEFAGIEPDDPIEKITKPMIRAYMEDQKENGTGLEKPGPRSGNAVNKDVRIIAAAWRWGYREFDDLWPAVKNPCKNIRPYPAKKNPRYVPPEEDFFKVYDVANEGQDKLMLQFLFQTAARRNEAFRLKFTDLDFEQKRIRLKTNKSKNGDERFRYIVMHDDLVESLPPWIQARKKMDGSDPDHVFVCTSHLRANTNDYGKPYKLRQYFMPTLCRRAGVEPAFGFHALRHLAASILYRDGISVYDLQNILGHASLTMTNNYVHDMGFERARSHVNQSLKILEDKPVLPDHAAIQHSLAMQMPVYQGIRV